MKLQTVHIAAQVLDYLQEHQEQYVLRCIQVAHERCLTDRLNEILPKIMSDGFLSGSGIGNEIAFYIFDYPPEEELRIRDHIRFLLEHIPKQRPELGSSTSICSTW